MADPKILSILNSAHALTQSQIDGLDRKFGVSLADLLRLPPDLQSQIDQSPSDFDSLLEVAEQTVRYALSQDVTHVLCPGGSPAFQATFAMEVRDTSLILLFSHSERVASEKDGVKTSTFVHRHWITV